MAAPNPMASVMGGVPASNLAGTGAVVKPSSVTSLIIEPPPRKGGISSSSVALPQSAPIPVGPHSLCDENT